MRAQEERLPIRISEPERGVNSPASSCRVVHVDCGQWTCVICTMILVDRFLSTNFLDVAFAAAFAAPPQDVRLGRE